MQNIDCFTTANVHSNPSVEVLAGVENFNNSFGGKIKPNT
jgi:hypothetical protein